jgi:flagellar protein FlgJ
MSVSITDYSSYYTQNTTNSVSSAQSSALESKISNLDVENSSDEELMEACKEFESYLVEQVIKQVKESMLDSDEDENEYMNVFGDTMVQNLASTISDTSDLGIAQSLYESMKNNLSSVKITSADTVDTDVAAENTVTNAAQQQDTVAEEEQDTTTKVQNVTL